MSITIFLTIALGIRVLLDLTTMAGPNWRMDIAYCVLFAMVAVMLLAEDQRDIWGYVCALVCVGWGLKALIVFKRQSKSRAVE